MNRKITLAIITSLLFLSSCKQTASETGYQAIGSYTKKAKKEWEWEICGIGGQFGDTIQKFNLDYDVVKESDVNEARRQLVKGVEKFLSMINQRERIIPLLVEFPFTNQRLKFGLSFSKPDGGFVEPNHIAYALLLNGTISYSITTPKRLEHVHEESYEEALQIVKNELNQNDKSSNANALKDQSAQDKAPQHPSSELLEQLQLQTAANTPHFD
jgi:hypothetical protein